MTSVPPPAVQLIGSAVLLQREAVLLVAELVNLGVHQLQQVNGISASPNVVKVQKILAHAATLTRDNLARPRRLDGQVVPVAAPSISGDTIGVAAAAVILRRSRRQTIRLARTLNGWGGSQGKAWSFSRAAVETYAAERKQ